MRIAASPVGELTTLELGGRFTLAPAADPMFARPKSEWVDTSHESMYPAKALSNMLRCKGQKNAPLIQWSKEVVDHAYELRGGREAAGGDVYGVSLAPPRGDKGRHARTRDDTPRDNTKRAPA